MSVFKLLLNLLKWTLTILITLIALYFLNSRFPVFGSYKPFIVQSGSMEPAISTGDIILVKEQGQYTIGDIITFDNKGLITHRIINVEDEVDKVFVTKGDANSSADEDKVFPEQIVGKVDLIIPRAGYLMSFVKTLNGFIFLVLIPAILYIIDELLKIIKNAQQRH